MKITRSKISADTIKQALPMREVVEHYGFEVNRAGFIPCPMHDEKTASCKIYENSFHCFGCGAGGDVIRFVQELFKIGFPQAIMRLNYDFHLGLDFEKPSAEATRLVAEQKKEREKAEELKKIKLLVYRDKQNQYRDLWRNRKNLSETEKTKATFLSGWLDRNLSLDFELGYELGGYPETYIRRLMEN